MKVALTCLVILFPLVSYAAPTELKDKYLDCNCHVTPGLPWKPVPVKYKPHHKHIIKQDEAKTDAPPAKTTTNITHNYTPATQWRGGYPGRSAIVPSNKLALPAGKSVYAPGQIVYISGRVLDKNCVPVSDAIVDIWQTDASGRYVKSTLGDRLSPFATFAGSGRATTDNLGRFDFVTVFPGTTANRAPFIHVHVVHKDFPTLDTEMFFAHDKRNENDPVYSSLSSAQRSALTAEVRPRTSNSPDDGLAATWDISLNGKNLWRHF